MTRKICVNVSNKADARNYYLSELAKNLKNPIILYPGVKPFVAPNSKTIYTIDFSEDGLLKILGNKTAKDIIVQEIHKMSPKTIDQIIKFAFSASLNVYFIGAVHNHKSGVYPVIDYLADMGCDINLLEEFVIDKELPLKKASTNGQISAKDLLDRANNLYNRLITAKTLKERKIEKTK